MDMFSPEKGGEETPQLASSGLLRGIGGAPHFSEDASSTFL